MPADVDEGAEVGQGLDAARELLALGQGAEDVSALLLPLVLEEELARHDGVLGLAVELDDPELEGLADER